jgi:hypothetical protein
VVADGGVVGRAEAIEVAGDLPAALALCCILLAASFVVPVFMTANWRLPQANAPVEQKVLYYATLFTFYFCLYMIMTFFNVALVAGAAKRMTGVEPTISVCLGEAGKRIHLILGWALVSATVGLVLRLIEERLPKLGQIVTAILGAAWAIVSFLVVPALVLDGLGPIAALKESGRKLRQTWGEQIVAEWSFGLIFLALFLGVGLMAGLGAYAAFSAGIPALAAACIALGVIGLITLALLQSALQTIFQTALYLNAKGVEERGFPKELMAQALWAK